MPYISELLNNKITDSSDSFVGYLEDIVIGPKGENFSPLEFLVIKSKDLNQVFVPYSYVENFTSSDISLKNIFSKIALNKLPDSTFIYLKKEVLDKQIVDVSGTRVVRVDDLRIGYVENRMCVLGIDTSVRGLLRRLGWEKLFFAKIFKVHFIDWRQAELLGSGPLQLKTMAENLKKLHPADLANIVEDLDVKRGSNLLSSMEDSQAAKVLEELDTDLQNILVKYLGPEKAGKMISHMPADEMADLVKTFSEPEVRQYFSQISGGLPKKVKKLADYPDNTAGGLMTLEYISVRPEWTVAQVLKEVRRLSPSFRSIFFVYITSEDGKFEGVVSLRRLIVAEPNIEMRKLAKTFATPSVLKPNHKIGKVIEIMTRYNLYTAAVVDKEKKLVGVITIDDVLRQLFPSA